MAYELPFNSVGMFSLDFDAFDVHDGQYTAVKLGKATNGADGTGMGRAALVRPAAGDLILGLIQANGKINEPVEVMVNGISMAKISAASAGGSVGDFLATKADGTLDKATSGQSAVAQALEDFEPGDTSSVLLGLFGKQ